MIQLLLLCLVAVVSSPSKEVMTYEKAYEKADKENKPLVVLVGADWCAACKTMKSTTIQKMQENGQLDDVVFAQIDRDARPELSQQIMQGDALPQIVVFAKNEDGWKKVSLTGIQSETRVRELIRRASSNGSSEVRLVR